MTDKHLKLEVAKRAIGKIGNREVQDDQVRGVVYGKTVESAPILADYNTLYKTFSQASGNKIIELNIVEGESHDVLFKDVDYHPVTNRILHFDLYAVTKGEKITVEVPVIMTGEIPAERGGLHVAVFIDSVEVSTVPRKLPEQLEVSAEKLIEVGDTITIADLIVADSEIEVLADSEATIAKVEEIQEMKVEDDGPTELPGEEAEGEEGEGAASKEEASSDAKSE